MVANWVLLPVSAREKETGEVMNGPNRFGFLLVGMHVEDERPKRRMAALAAFPPSEIEFASMGERPHWDAEPAGLEFRFVVESSNSQTGALGQTRTHGDDRFPPGRLTTLTRSANFRAAALSVLKGSGRVISDQFGVNLLAA